MEENKNKLMRKKKEHKKEIAIKETEKIINGFYPRGLYINKSILLQVVYLIKSEFYKLCKLMPNFLITFGS